MEHLVTGNEMKCYDDFTINELGIPSLVLMERAALAAYQQLLASQVNLSNILIVCGSGNNGGDGFALARLLNQANIKVTVLFVGHKDTCTSETIQQWNIAQKLAIPVCMTTDIRNYTTIVDAIFGTGLSRNIDGELAILIDQINQSQATILALDIPSGIHAESGKVMGIAIKADQTISFGFKKIGCVLYPGANYVGDITVADIGISQQALVNMPPACFSYTETDLNLLPKRKANSHKGSFGKVLIIAGSENMSGAAYFSAKAALCSGAGVIKIYSPVANRIILQSQLPEAIFIAYDPRNIDQTDLQQQVDWATAIVIGPGLSQSQQAQSLLNIILNQVRVPIIIDADALNLIAASPELLNLSHHDWIVTPHPGEMARLTNKNIKQITTNLIAEANTFARQHHVICVLKDSRTVVSDGRSATYLNQSGCQAMSKGGAGDTLTGIIAAFIAQGMSARSAAQLAVYLHGLAGQQAASVKGDYSVLASDIIDAISNVIKKWQEGSAIVE